MGVARPDEADRFVRDRIEEASARFPGRREIDFPAPHRIFPGSMAEVADIHRELYLENRDRTARTSREGRGLPRGQRSDAAEAAATREAYRERAGETLGEPTC